MVFTHSSISTPTKICLGHTLESSDRHRHHWGWSLRPVYSRAFAQKQIELSDLRNTHAGLARKYAQGNASQIRGLRLVPLRSGFILYPRALLRRKQSSLRACRHTRTPRNLRRLWRRVPEAPGADARGDEHHLSEACRRGLRIADGEWRDIPCSQRSYRSRNCSFWVSPSDAGGPVAGESDA